MPMSTHPFNIAPHRKLGTSARSNLRLRHTFATCERGERMSSPPYSAPTPQNRCVRLNGHRWNGDQGGLSTSSRCFRSSALPSPRGGSRVKLRGSSRCRGRERQGRRLRDSVGLGGSGRALLGTFGLHSTERAG
jgi:hypothetical protein